jgi:hypothetical protein
MKPADRKAMPKPVPVMDKDQIRLALTLELREQRRRKAEIAERIREIEKALGTPKGKVA